MRVYLFVALALFAYLAHGGFVETAYTATLSTNQEVPLPLDPPPSAGVAVCVLTRRTSPPVLDCEVQHNVNEVSGAHIHVAARGLAGRIVFEFSGSTANHFRQSFSIVDLENYPATSQIDDFLNGLFYINIHSEDYPSGEIRGQLEHTDRFYARLSATNTIPHASGTSAHGLAVGTYSTQNPSRELAFDIVHSVQQPLQSGLEIRSASPGQIGPLVFSFRNAESPAYESVQYTINEEADFFRDLHYINVLSQRNPTGEIRGQMVTIDYIDELSFTARLDSEQSVPQTDSNNRGNALFAYHCDTKVLEYVVMHNIPDPRGAFIGSAPAGDAGVTLFSLTSGSSPIYGSIQLVPEEELLLYSRSLYISIVSVEFSAGEIRGQITVDFDWWAYLSGTSVVSPVTTSSVGIATMTLFGEQNRKLDYSIFHSVETPLRTSLNIAREGDNGPLDLVFPSTFSPIRGDDIVLDDDELEAFVTEGSYISVTSLDNPFLGEIRGQIRRVNPCTASNDNSLTVSLSDGNGDEDEKAIEAEDRETMLDLSDEALPVSTSSSTFFFYAGDNKDNSAAGSLATGSLSFVLCLLLLANYL